MRLVGLYREAEYSPGRHRSNDALLLEEIAACLTRQGCDVELTTADAPGARRQARSARMVFSMCQGRAALEQLVGWQADGVRIVNNPGASLNTYRDRLATLMSRAGIRFPSTRFVETAGEDKQSGLDVNGGLWLKRGDVHAATSADVQWVDSEDRLRAALAEFHARGIQRAALQQHEPGREIKFYGVAGGRFFHWLYVDSERNAFAGGAKGRDRAPAVDVDALRRIAEAAADAAGLDVFGGDAIVGRAGALTLIDLNDWPSFAPCRDRASVAIAGCLLQYAKACDPAVRAAI